MDRSETVRMVSYIEEVVSDNLGSSLQNSPVADL